MVTKEKLEKALGRLALLRRFPSHPQALVALGEILRETCPNDTDLAELVHEVLKTSDDWCGPAAIRKTYKELVKRRNEAEAERLRQERIAAACIERKKHEEECSGYGVDINKEDKTVFAYFCNKYFGDFYDHVMCRCGDKLAASDKQAVRRIAAETLASHPGFELWGLPK